ncbi:MAG: hypothetical protein V1752_00960 [Candidatus Firestonebacteria bacterium]
MKVAAKRELLNEIKNLPSDLTKDVLKYVVFVKYKKIVDTDQSYFWSKKWQNMEKEAEKNIKEEKTHKYRSLKEFKIKMGD